ncbi:MAG: HupE/UreJ family protein [Bacteroidetes bacterium]|nr:MAG: HupE/UreJ family protein [Bacteroidota bacterium]
MDLSSCFSGAGLYLQLGWEHILDIQGYDHILFVVALAAVYRVRQWRQVLILVTAFTLGHSLTLALSVLDIFRLSSELVETLIPVTILLTCVYNVVRGEHDHSAPWQRANYLLALVFGFIHGMGFSNYLRALLGSESCLGGPLLSFNVGLELGQLLIVAAAMLLSWLVVDRLRLRHHYWNLGISVLVGLMAIQLMLG